MRGTPTLKVKQTMPVRDRSDMVWSFVALAGEQGTLLHIAADSMVTADGTLVTGLVELELVELYDKGSMLVTDMPSVGLNAAGERARSGRAEAVARDVDRGERSIVDGDCGEERRHAGDEHLAAKM